MGNYAKNLYLKWWIWPLLLIVVQIIQFILFKHYMKIEFDNSQAQAHLIKMASLKDAISIITIVLYIFNIGLWISYIITKHGSAIAGHLILMGVASIISISNIFLIGFWAAFNDRLFDDFGKQHSIPENIEYNEPLNGWINIMENDSVIRTDKVNPEDYVIPDDISTWLQVKNGGQGGIYQYTYYIPEGIDDGEIWLECYEVTDNTQLSSETVKERTLQKVTAQDSQTFTAPKEFVIYEGNWGEFYLARFEVWYIDYATRTKRKLAEKIYKVEGWMR